MDVQNLSSLTEVVLFLRFDVVAVKHWQKQKAQKSRHVDGWAI